MLHTLLGEESFKHACNRYFEKFDGQAVTTDDFVDTMEEVSGLDLAQFRRWYSQAGTPVVSLTTRYDPASRTLHLDFAQQTPDTPGQTNKPPLLIPIKLALFNGDGQRMRFDHAGQTLDETVLQLSEARQTIELEAVENEPVLSLLRGFSAPVRLDYAQSEQTLAFLARHEDDAFGRWEAMQRLSMLQINAIMDNTPGFPSAEYLSTFTSFLQDRQSDPALLAQLLHLPTEAYISQSMEVIDPDLVHRTRKQLIREIANAHREALHERYMQEHTLSSGHWSAVETGRRALRDACLMLMMRIEHEGAYMHATRQYEQSACMTDTMAALTALVHSEYPNKRAYLEDFFRQWHQEDLLVDKWFNLQSQQVGKDANSEIVHLSKHPSFDPGNPNKVYALIGGFLHGNAVVFHDRSGKGYRFAADWVLRLDATNPQVAARMVGCFNQWKRYDAERQTLMKAQMQRIADHEGLSDNVSEIIHKALA